MSSSRTPYDVAHRRRRRLLNTVALAPVALLAVGSAVVQVGPSAYHGTTQAAPQPAPAATAPAVVAEPEPDSDTQPPIAIPTDGPEVASPVRGVATTTLAREASYAAIPGEALAAYQRAAAVIDESAPACHLSWTLLGGLGQVESGHGEVARARTTGAGILGVRLNGKNGTRAVPDTDGGSLDGDVKWDRAVGPLQFLPSTWRAVGVDADGDGTRDPQDIDDASLAAAVYLCGSGQDLATRKGQRLAVHAYNHSDRYVRSVLRVAASYVAGEQTAVAVPISVSTQVVDPLATATVATPKKPKPKPKPAVAVATAAVTPKPAPPAPAVAAAPPVDPEVAAKQTCRDQGLVDDPAKQNDDFDVCVAKELGLPVPAPDPTPTPTPEPSPAPSTPAG